MNLTAIKSTEQVRFDVTNAFVAGAVFLISFVVYFLTKAPTFSFWDCGEFVASAYILGVPHPPGTPLYVLLGRLFFLLPIAGDIAVRINLLSVVSSAAAAMLGYLILVRMIRYWIVRESDIISRILPYLGGFVGALFMAFSNTNWGNSVEAEVYALAILMMLVIYWLGLKYFENRETSSGGRLMVLVGFVAMLGIGVHLTIFVVLPVIALYFILRKEAGPREWGIISFFFLAELYMIFELSSRPGEVPAYFPVLILFVIFLFHTALSQQLSRNILITLGLFAVALYPLLLTIISAFAVNVLKFESLPVLLKMSGLPVGTFGLVILSGWGLWAAYNRWREKGQNEESRSWFIIGVYSLAPGFLILTGLIFSGYSSFLILTAVLILILGLFLRHFLNRIILLAITSISLVILGVWQLVWGVLIGSAAIIMVGLILKEKAWKTGLAIIILAILGYSVHIYIPVRSTLEPMIDMNDPSQSLAAVVGFLERKQYGSETMVERMFVRRGEWQNQFGDYQRMGFWRFFKEQYGFGGRSFFIILVIGLFGFWEMIRRKADIGIPFLLLFLICSVGIVLYMNFADGTRQDPTTQLDYLEVRNRDYFYTPAFVLFGMAIGMGIAGVVEMLRDTIKSHNSLTRKGILIFAGLLALTPIVPLKANFHSNDRSRNFLPYDYAENYLQSCEVNSILFTNGDNDTFPLWCLQEVYGIRKDVRVVNLSLANTSWYIKQLRDKLHVPIEWGDAAIDKLRPYMSPEGGVMRIQDQVLEHVIAANNWENPIFMTVTVPQDSKRFKGRSLDENLILEGMVYRLIPIKGKDQINYERTRNLVLGQYKYRGVNDPSVYKDENAARLTGNYAQGFVVMADSMRRAGDLEGAFAYLKKGLEVIPQSFDLYQYGAQLLGQMGRLDTMQLYIQNSPFEEKWKLYFNWGIAAKVAGRVDEAIRVLELTHQMYPDYTDGYRALVSYYYQYKFFSKLRQVVTNWVAKHPDDYESRQLLNEIQQLNPILDTIEGVR